MRTRNANSRRQVRLGIDIGGTFTDLVAEYPDGNISRVKILTTPANPSEGVLTSIRKFLDEDKAHPRIISVVIHATTLASNALLSGSIPKVALVTTEGFRDVLEIGRQNRPELYNLQFDRINPLVPRRFRFEIQERTAYDGKVLEPVNSGQVQRVARAIRRGRFESVAICFLHSYANARNEQLAARIIRRSCPGTFLSVSSELIPEFREYERTSTTVVNACLQPIVSRYLASLKTGLSSMGIKGPVFVMQSNGGTILSEQASEEPSRIIESGPVAGAVAARAYGHEAEAGAILSLDIGGTTAKAGVWSGNRFDVTSEYEVGGRLHGVQRLVGSGYPVRFPYVDLVEVGIGGGSIARMDQAGVLHVGPESAGAAPGPACYGLGGTEPTLTDANLVLGRLNPEHLLGGQLSIEADRAYEAIQKKIARPMKTSVTAAAVGILKIATANMAQALRAASVERGRDPRSMVLVAFGGAGPMHACELAQQLDIHEVIVPPRSGLFSAMGLLLAEPLHDFVETILALARDVKASVLNEVFRKMELNGKALLRREGIDERRMTLERFFDMRYQGQSYELSVPIERGSVRRALIARAVKEFHQLHRRNYGYSATEESVEIVNLRTYCKGRLKTRLARMGQTTNALSQETRRVYFDPRFVNGCRVYMRDGLEPGSKGQGPCIVEDYDSTTVVPPRATYHLNHVGSLVINPV